MRKTGWCCVVVGVALVAGVDASADEQATELRDQVVEAYGQTDTYLADVTFQATQKQGRWQLTQQFRIAFDRSGNKLLIDRPDLLLICDGETLFVRSAQFPGRHLEAEVEQPLAFRALMRAAPFLLYPPLPDVAFLLGEDPTAFSGAMQRLPADSFDFDQRPRLKFRTRDGEMTYLVDPQTHLVTGAMRIGEKVIGPLQPEPTEMEIRTQVVRHNEQFDEDVFAFDRTNSQAIDSFQPDESDDAPASFELEGEASPPIDLNTLAGDAFLLTESEADVVVLEFWASWCMPCHRSIEAMQQLHDWVNEEGTSVQVMAVNLREQAVDVEAFWEWKKLTLPTLMDVDGRASLAYRVGPLPQTVIIADGVVQHVNVGLSDEPQLRARIEALLPIEPSDEATDSDQVDEMDETSTPATEEDTEASTTQPAGE